MTQDKGFLISPSAQVSPDAEIQHPVTIRRNAEVKQGARIGAYSLINAGSVVFDNVTIGRFSSLSRRTQVGVATHPLDFLSTHSFQFQAYDFPGHPAASRIQTVKQWQTYPRTTIGNDVWIGANAVVKAGINVGDGAVVGSGAVVAADVPPFAIVGGVPARLIRYRFPESVINNLLELRWWDLPLETILGLPFDSISSCIDRLREARAVKSMANN